MLVATALTALGFLVVAEGTFRYGLRFGGAIVVSVVAVHTLKDFSTLPIFLASTVIAYGALWYVKRHTLVYGRDEFIVAILAGSLIPAIVYLFTVFLPGDVQLDIYRSVFIGSLLSGIAAYNFNRVRPEYRRQELVATGGLYVALLALGALLVSPSTRFIAEYTPLFLFAPTSDIAVLRGAVVQGFVDPPFVTRPIIIGIYALTLGLSELVRQQFGIRVGTVALGLLALYTVSTWQLFALFVVTMVAAFLFVQGLHAVTILYGRALLCVAAAISVIFAVPLASVWNVSAGISTLFTGILAGLLGYYAHATPPQERRQQLLLAVAVFLPLLGVVRAAVAPGPDGFPQTLDAPTLAVGAVVTLVALTGAVYLRIDQPSDEAVRRASVFEGGGD